MSDQTDTQSDPNDSPSDTTTCEYCGERFAPRAIGSHKHYCDAKPDESEQTASASEPNERPIEADDASTSDDVSLDGTTDVTTAESFSSLDAFELDAETQGDVVIEDSSGNELARIRGANSYDGVEGDLGVPLLGAGSHADPIGTEYERFLNDTVTRGGSELAAEVRSAGLSVDNGYDKSPIAGTKEQAVHIGQQEIEFSATVAGNFAHQENPHEHLQTQSLDIEWEYSGGGR